VCVAGFRAFWGYSTCVHEFHVFSTCVLWISQSVSFLSQLLLSSVFFQTENVVSLEDTERHKSRQNNWDGGLRDNGSGGERDKTASGSGGLHQQFPQIGETYR
jgi:hypothetical protein